MLEGICSKGMLYFSMLASTLLPKTKLSVHAILFNGEHW